MPAVALEDVKLLAVLRGDGEAGHREAGENRRDPADSVGVEHVDVAVRTERDPIGDTETGGRCGTVVARRARRWRIGDDGRDETIGCDPSNDVILVANE